MKNKENIYKSMVIKEDDIFKNVYAFIREFDVEWENKIKPASEEKIEKLKKVAFLEERGYELPEIYIEFLRRMGENDGGIIGYDSKTTSISELIEYYEDELDMWKRWYLDDEIEEELEVYLKENYIDGELANEFYFSIDNMGEEDLQIIFTNENKYFISMYHTPFSTSFGKCLMQSAIRRYGNMYLKYGCALRGKEEDVLKKYENYAINNDYRIAWCSNKYELLLVKKNSLIRFTKGTYLFCYIEADDKNEIKKIQKDLVDLYDMQIARDIEKAKWVDGEQE